MCLYMVGVVSASCASVSFKAGWYSFAVVRTVLPWWNFQTGFAVAILRPRSFKKQRILVSKTVAVAQVELKSLDERQVVSQLPPKVS